MPPRKTDKVHGRGAGDKMVTQISVDPQAAGAVAVYLVEAASEEESRSLGGFFGELTACVTVAQLSRGRLTSYAVQTHDPDPSVLDDIERALGSSYALVTAQRSFDSVIYGIITELSSTTGSKLLPIPHCNICGRPEPFPDTLITLEDASGRAVMSRSYCGRCAAGLVARTNKGFILSLLSADRRNFGGIERSELVRSRGRGHGLRYNVRRPGPVSGVRTANQVARGGDGTLDF